MAMPKHTQPPPMDELYGSESIQSVLNATGDHMHHGYLYDDHPHLHELHAAAADLNGKSAATLICDNAAVRLIEELLKWAHVAPNLSCSQQKHEAWKILDVGCGLGAVSRYLATKFPSVTVQGISLTKAEVEMARKLTASKNLSDQVSFMVADALNLPFPDNEFKLVWCMECADHISDRNQLIKELARVTALGGQVVLSTVCSRELLPHETSLGESDKEVQMRICDEISLAPCSPPSLYTRLVQEQGLKEIRSGNWTKYVSPSVRVWIHCDNSMLSENADNMQSHKMSAYSSFLKGYEQGIIEYFILTATKPSS